jgi:hypothetical protein
MNTCVLALLPSALCRPRTITPRNSLILGQQRAFTFLPWIYPSINKQAFKKDFTHKLLLVKLFVLVVGEVLSN